MGDNKKHINDVSVVVSNDFKISDSDSLIPAGDFKSLEEFRIYLTKKLSVLLDYKFDTLINILYRIDVNEERLKELFASSNREFIPATLAELIIERSIQKVKFRQKYKSGKL